MSDESDGYRVTPGFVYVLLQQPGSEFVKIGITKDVVDRLKSLDTTGVPVPPTALWYEYVANPAAVEEESHRRLSELRVRSSREWFRAEAALAIKAVAEVAEPYRITPYQVVKRVDFTIRMRERFGSLLRRDLQQVSIIHTVSRVVLETIRRNAHHDAFIAHRILDLPEEDRQSGAEFRNGGSAEEHAQLILDLDEMTLAVLYGPDLIDYEEARLMWNRRGYTADESAK